ncbi:MAG TPA: hypothetical protein VGW34_09445 [Allosphingosinicella sp.]|nr:hypothetical protein [Allosphingosinicella sp.]
MLEGDARDRTACASGLPIHYSPDGSYSLWEETGTWQLHHDRLTETATAANEVVDSATVDIGRPHLSRLRWVSRDEFVKTFADGRQFRFLRCPEPK